MLCPVTDHIPALEAQGTAILWTEYDGDTHGITDACDPSVSFFNLDLTDTNADGIPNECQCGDTNGDGFLTAVDASEIITCGSNPAAATGNDSTPFDIELWDTNLHGFATSLDAFNDLSRGALGSDYLNVCPRRPEGIPAPSP